MRSENKLYGLVLCGGKSSRMGFEKSELSFYNNKKHKYFLYELLEEYCDEVFISCTESQTEKTDPDYKIITDLPVYENSGPMAALLSFREKYPGNSVIAVGCDYPFIDRACIEKLIRHRNEKAVCYINKVDGNIYEPLLTIYESPFLKTIQDNFNRQNFSLSRILKEDMVKTIDPTSELILRNVNTFAELTETDNLIRNFNIKHNADTL